MNFSGLLALRLCNFVALCCVLCTLLRFRARLFDGLGGLVIRLYNGAFAWTVEIFTLDSLMLSACYLRGFPDMTIYWFRKVTSVSSLYPGHFHRPLRQRLHDGFVSSLSNHTMSLLASSGLPGEVVVNLPWSFVDDKLNNHLQISLDITFVPWKWLAHMDYSRRRVDELFPGSPLRPPGLPTNLVIKSRR